MRYLLVLLITISISPLALHAQKIAAVNANQLMQRFHSRDTIYVINFWATWCIPCVKELPAFDSVQRKYDSKPVKVLLVSLDFKDDYEKKLTAFINKRKPLPQIVWFSETNANEFIPKIDDRWSGALPATMIISGNEKLFLEQTVNLSLLSSHIDLLLHRR